MKRTNNLNKIAGILFAILFLGPFSIVLGQKNTAKEILTFKHERGETKVRKDPKRVVIFDIGTLETYHELNIPVVGVPNSIPAYLPEYKETKYTKAGSLKGPDINVVKSLNPDLIIISGRQASSYDSLSAIAPTLFVSVDPTDSWNSFERNVRNIAMIHGMEKQVEAKLASLKKKVEQVKSMAQKDPNRALTALYVNNRFAPNGPNSRFGFAYDVLGLKSAYNETPAAKTPGTKKQAAQTEGNEASPAQPKAPEPYISKLNPDYIFIIDRQEATSGVATSLEKTINDDIRETRAYENNKVFLLPGNVWYLAGGGLISVDKQITGIGQQLYGLTF